MTLWKEKEIQLSWGKCSLRYDMIVNNLYNSHGSIIGEAYGVRVSLCDAADNRPIESREITNITLFPTEAERLLSLLAKGQVTPYALEDVVSEYIGQA